MNSAATQMLSPTTGKTAGGENFPVASWLLPVAVRRQVMAFYHFARTADDIADDSDLAPERKLAHLEALEQGLRGLAEGDEVETALALRRAVACDEALLGHAAQLLQAFRRDAVTDHCRDWADLMTYCRFSAAPVGRFLLALHGEGAETAIPGDALCTAHQVLNHLQDCGKDYLYLGRVYIPRNWMLEAGLANDVLTGTNTPDELRQVLDRVLDGVDGLIDLARPLPGLIADRRLRQQAAVTLSVAERLSALLRDKDPLAAPIRLSRGQYLAAFASGFAHGFRRG